MGNILCEQHSAKMFICLQIIFLACLIQFGASSQEGSSTKATALNNSSLSLVLGDQCVTRDEVQAVIRAEVESVVQAELQSVRAEMWSIVRNETQSLFSNLVEAQQSNTNLLLHAINSNPLGTPGNPAPSCKNISPGSPSGYYYIQTNSGNPLKKYCNMERTCCGGSTGGWMQVANIDMTDPNQHCPSGFKNVTSPRRSCGRPDGVGGCVSTTFPVHSVEYSKVCGRVIGYQFGSPNAFDPYIYGRDTIDDVYVDGAVLTYGSATRNHIWTFAGMLDDVTTNVVNNCPCSRPDLDYTQVIPSFVGENYFCETGSRSRYGERLYHEDPLWDGQGCRRGTCCDHPLYFCAQLSQPTRDDIELRLCGDQESSNEDTPLELVEIYIQ